MLTTLCHYCMNEVKYWLTLLTHSKKVLGSSFHAIHFAYVSSAASFLKSFEYFIMLFLTHTLSLKKGIPGMLESTKKDRKMHNNKAFKYVELPLHAEMYRVRPVLH